MQEPLVTISLEEYNKLLSNQKEEDVIPVIGYDNNDKDFVFSKHITAENKGNLVRDIQKFLQKQNLSHELYSPRF